MIYDFKTFYLCEDMALAIYETPNQISGRTITRTLMDRNHQHQVTRMTKTCRIFHYLR